MTPFWSLLLVTGCVVNIVLAITDQNHHAAYGWFTAVVLLFIIMKEVK
jgi:hypothetical protein